MSSALPANLNLKRLVRRATQTSIGNYSTVEKGQSSIQFNSPKKDQSTKEPCFKKKRDQNEPVRKKLLVKNYSEVFRHQLHTIVNKNEPSSINGRTESPVTVGQRHSQKLHDIMLQGRSSQKRVKKIKIFDKWELRDLQTSKSKSRARPSVNSSIERVSAINPYSKMADSLRTAIMQNKRRPARKIGVKAGESTMPSGVVSGDDHRRRRSSQSPVGTGHRQKRTSGLGLKTSSWRNSGLAHRDSHRDHLKPKEQSMFGGLDRSALLMKDNLKAANFLEYLKNGTASQSIRCKKKKTRNKKSIVQDILEYEIAKDLRPSVEEETSMVRKPINKALMSKLSSVANSRQPVPVPMTAEYRAINHADYARPHFDKQGREKYTIHRDNMSVIHLHQNNPSVNDAIDLNFPIKTRESNKVNRSFNVESQILESARSKQSFLPLYGSELVSRASEKGSPVSKTTVIDLEFDGTLQNKTSAAAKIEAEEFLRVRSASNSHVLELIEDIKSQFKRQSENFGLDHKTTLDYYEMQKCIGKGAFGKVHQAVQILTGAEVAIKTVNKKSINLEQDEKEKIENEIRILSSVSQVKNAIQLLEVFETSDFYFLVMEFVADGDLLGFLKKNGLMKEAQAKRIFYDIVEGLEGLHKLRIVHRDIKLDNILLTSQGRAKLGDFGISKKLASGELLRDKHGTPAYLSPEAIRDQGYAGFEADVWSLGIALHAIIYGRVPFKAPTIEELYEKVLNDDLTFPSLPTVSRDLMDLLAKMLVKNPKERITLAEMKDHAWFSDRQTDDQWGNNGQESDKSEQARLYLEMLGFPPSFVSTSLKRLTLNHAVACFKSLTSAAITSN